MYVNKTKKNKEKKIFEKKKNTKNTQTKHKSNQSVLKLLIIILLTNKIGVNSTVIELIGIVYGVPGAESPNLGTHVVCYTI